MSKYEIENVKLTAPKLDRNDLGICYDISLCM